ncbi:transcription factor GTE6 [Argentina anserina]|uniref:transcription factor GTE6 n=1 Tax=Argentina anserina TaxID=57926 RepID=UPI0021762FA3|nr:transcription factor GTE6 [Potentilla anserina]XP_050380089.1 transcription factor GTE6 [Potentilla anserina]
MSQAEKDLVVSSKHRKLGPDYFGYYTNEVVELLSRNEDVSPFASDNSDISQSRRVGIKGKDRIEHSNGVDVSPFASVSSDVSRSRHVGVIGKDRTEHSNGVSALLFSDRLGNELSDFKKERLRLLLRQGVKVLAREVDEMIEPAVAMSRLKSKLESRKCLSSSAACDVDAEKAPSPKRLKRSSCSSSSLSALSCPTDPEPNREVDDELQSLIESNSLQVEEVVKKYSDQYHNELGHMEQQLEKILDSVMSKCRPMTIYEKNKLGKLIQKLPPENLDRVMEIIQNSNTAFTNSSDEVHVDLKEESNVTLWRLFHYVEAIENARKLAK